MEDFVEGAEGRWSMAMTIEAHHALVDDQFLATVQQAADAI